MDEIGKQLDVISNALDNTDVKKRSKQVHAKLTKQERHEAKHKQFELQRMMTATPHQALRASLKNVKDTISAKASAVKTTAQAAVVSMGETLQPRQKKSKADPSTGGGKKTPEFVIRLPRPANEV